MAKVTLALTVRIDEADGTDTVPPGKLLGLFDEARFDLYGALVASGVDVGRGHAARAESLRLTRPLRSREAVRIDAALVHLGTTSYAVGHVMRDAGGAVVATLRSTLVCLLDGQKAPLSASLRAVPTEPFEAPLPAPEPPDGSIAFLRTSDVCPSDENRGGHMARTRMADRLDDLRRVALGRAAFELDPGPGPHTLAAMSLLYEREVHAGESLRGSIASPARGVFDAMLVRGREVVTRARLWHADAG